eukprot:6745011-Alexandrium_andersonii.AAC.1
MDADAQVGSVLSASVGGHSPSTETDSGAYLREAMDRFGLCLPSTMRQCAQDVPPETWFSSPGKDHRLDYVAIP